MNDNRPPANTVIDLMARAKTTAALVLPNGVTDLLVLGLRPDGTLYFNSEADLPKIFMLLALANAEAMGHHLEESGQFDGVWFDDEPPPRRG